MMLEETLVIIGSAIAIVISLFVVIICLTLIDTKNKRFNRIILFIAFSDLCTNIGNVIGFPPDGFWCWTQGILTHYFSRTSWAWTIFLCHSIYSAVKYGKFYYSMQFAHKVCWGIPMLLSVTPLITCVYRQIEEFPQWCILERRDGIPEQVMYFWNAMWAFTWFFVTCGSMAVMQTIIFFKFKNSPYNNVVRKTYDKIWLYPIVLGTSQIIYFLCASIEFESPRLILTIGMLALNMYAIATAGIFLWKSDEAHFHLKRVWKETIAVLAKGSSEAALGTGATATNTTITSSLHDAAESGGYKSSSYSASNSSRGGCQHSRSLAQSLICNVSEDEEPSMISDFIDDTEFEELLVTLSWNIASTNSAMDSSRSAAASSSSSTMDQKKKSVFSAGSVVDGSTRSNDDNKGRQISSVSDGDWARSTSRSRSTNSGTDDPSTRRTSSVVSGISRFLSFGGASQQQTILLDQRTGAGLELGAETADAATAAGTQQAGNSTGSRGSIVVAAVAADYGDNDNDDERL